MRKINYVLILANFLSLILAYSAFAQETLETKSLLWKIEGPNIQPSYLYGTIHVYPEKKFVLKEKIRQAFAETEQLVLEIDMSNAVSVGLQMFQYAAMKDGMTLDKLISAEDYTAIDSYIISKHGMGLAMIKNWQPSLLSSLVLEKVMPGPIVGFEEVFLEMAQEKDMEVLGLETVRFQCEIFHEMDYQEQAEDLLRVFRAEPEIKELYETMIEIYNQEDVHEIHQISVDYYKEHPEQTKIIDNLIYTRNQNWIPLIQKYTREKSSFIGVGAGHLGGKKGVINLLREAGFTLTPIE